jgi:UDP-N-acetylglucosamine acyltransferase
MIHPSALISPKANIGTNVAIGAYTIVEDNVTIGDNSIIEPHVIVRSGTQIGANNHIYQFSSIGEHSQDRAYAGEASYLLIGDNNIIRESCVIHRGTDKDHNTTKIGNDNLIMSHCHVAHDCVLGNNITMASYSALAGHVHIYDKAILGGATLIHQYCHIGSYSMSAINTVILKDVPAYVMVGGNVARERGMNYEGMRRLDYSQEQISSLRNAYRIVYRNSYTIGEALAKIDLLAQDDNNIKLFAASIHNSQRGITR